MLPKPKPKYDITTEKVLDELWITVRNTAAESWLNVHATSFGPLKVSSGDRYDYTLVVRSIYDIDEVQAYIDSYNDRDKGIWYNAQGRIARPTFDIWYRN